MQSMQAVFNAKICPLPSSYIILKSLVTIDQADFLARTNKQKPALSLYNSIYVHIHFFYLFLADF